MTASHLPEERRQQILAILANEGKVTALDLCERLTVSIDTVRRDLKDLENAGQLNRVHGGALPLAPGAMNYQHRSHQGMALKQAIGRATAELLRPGQTIFIDSGTTPLAVAQALPPTFVATIITNSPPVALALAQHSQLKIVMPGGELNLQTMSLTGAATALAISRLRADVAIIGGCGIDPDIGLTAADATEAQIKQLLCQQANEILVPLTADKFGTAVNHIVEHLDNIDHLITDIGLTAAQSQPYQQAGIIVTRVTP